MHWPSLGMGFANSYRRSGIELVTNKIRTGAVGLKQSCGEEGNVNFASFR